MPDVIKCLERFVEEYNRPGSNVYHLYAAEVEWVFTDGGANESTLDEAETATGVVGNREEMFAAFRRMRGQTIEQAERGEPGDSPLIRDMKFPEVRHMSAVGSTGILDCTWQATLVTADGAEDIPMRAYMLFILDFNEDGLITRDRDYWIERK